MLMSRLLPVACLSKPTEEVQIKMLSKQNKRRVVSHSHVRGALLKQETQEMKITAVFRVCLRYLTQQNGAKQTLGSTQTPANHL